MAMKDNIQNLVQCQNLLRDVCFSGDNFKKKLAIYQINNILPGIANEVIDEICKRYPNDDIVIVNNAFELSPFGLELNVDLYLYVINNRLNQCYNWSISSTAIQKIFFQPQSLSQEYVLYTRDEKELKVSDFLSVLSYGKKFAEAFFGVESPKANEYVLAAKTVDLAINHQEVDKPLNKTLHIINDVLTEYGKDLHKDKGEKMVLSGISLLVDLVIDFLVKA